MTNMKKKKGKTFMQSPWFIALSIFTLLVLLFCIGLKIRPAAFVPINEEETELQTMPLPAGLPEPVEEFYRTVYGDEIPVITSVVIQGRGVLKPMLNLPIQARFIFKHNAGKDYSHYFEATLFGVPILKIREGYIDGKSYFESPMGNSQNKPKANQGANLALWAEAIWFPSVWITDARVHWEAVNDSTALLYVPFEDSEDFFVVHFDPKTHLIDLMEAMRYRETEEMSKKILWICGSRSNGMFQKDHINLIGDVTWLDQGKPWATFYVEELDYSADLQVNIQK